MAYQDLEKFQDVFNSPSFAYISNHNNIKNVSDVILKVQIPFNETVNSNYKELKKFLLNLDDFYKAFFGSAGNRDIDEGCSVIRKTLELCINLLSEPTGRRESIGRGYIRKWNKDFLHGLGKLLNGIRDALDPDTISSTKIRENNLVHYILEKNVGLGRRFLFNKLGKHSFANMITELDRKKLIVAMKLLLKGSGQRKRDWMVLGSRKDSVRILCEHRNFRKDKVYYLFPINEHDEYEKALMASPQKMKFSPA